MPRREAPRNTSKCFGLTLGKPAAIIPNAVHVVNRQDLTVALLGTDDAPTGFIAVTIERTVGKIVLMVDVRAIERTDGKDCYDVFKIHGAIADAGIVHPVRIVLNVRTHTGTFVILKSTERWLASRAMAGSKRAAMA